MGMLLKEALRTICEGNQWSYAVLWKFSCQNPRLLIWEESYCDSSVNSKLYKVDLLMYQMMNRNQFYIVGEGLVGRVAFTGEHEWTLYNDYLEGKYPSEVITDLHHHFASGIQTIALIPVLHGVVQFGSFIPMMENMGFVNDVKSLILELGFIPGALFPDAQSSLPVHILPQFHSIPLSDSKIQPGESHPAFNISKNCVSEVLGVLSDGYHEAFGFSGFYDGKKEALNIDDKVSKQRESFGYEFSSDFENFRSLDGEKSLGEAQSGDELFNIFCQKRKNIVMDDDHLSLFVAGKDCESQNLQESFDQSHCSDHLLDAVVSGAFSCNKVSSSDLSSSSGSGSKQLLDPVKVNGKSCGFESQLTSWVSYSGRQDSSLSVGVGKRQDDSSKTPRKRLKPGENPRPRPKDRQMIQDRVKELREIVPNSTKCSIDSLLERTIKHMLFLQSVTKHAEKLKQAGAALGKENFGGKTWAYEVGSQSTICPLKVEDLNPPHQFLIEMLCEERGLFLEIADTIRSMGLTILKGVMESRNSKIWAQFAVEAERVITRKEVFISLVNLLEQLKNNIKTIDSDHMNIHNCFPPATSIPATGRASVLQ